MTVGGRRLAWGCGILLLLAVVAFGGVGGWLGWQGSDRNLPPLAHGMPSEFAAGDRLFKQRVAARYPVGSVEAVLIADLKAQGFKIMRYDDPRYWDGVGSISRIIFCGGKEWDVRWKADRGRITEILGVYGANCL